MVVVVLLYAKSLCIMLYCIDELCLKIIMNFHNTLLSLRLISPFCSMWFIWGES